MRLGLGLGLGKAGGTMSGVMGGPVPVNTVAPVVSGTARVGQTLAATTGTWSGSPTSYTYQWTRNGSNISGATSATYLTVVADMGTLVRCVVTAINAGGPSTPAASNSLDIFNFDDVSNLAVWLDANDPACVLRDTGSGFVPALNGEAVARWVDKSTNGHIIAQTVAGSRPLLSTSNGPSAGRAINFDGADDFLLSGLVLPRPSTVFIVVANRSYTTNDVIFHTAAAGAASQLRQLAGNTVGRAAGGPSVSMPVNEWGLITVVTENNAYRIRKNSDAQVSETVTTVASTGFILGAQIGPINFAHADIAGCIAYSRLLTDPEIATVQATLKAIYGTP